MPPETAERSFWATPARAVRLPQALYPEAAAEQVLRVYRVHRAVSAAAEPWVHRGQPEPAAPSCPEPRERPSLTLQAQPVPQLPAARLVSSGPESREPVRPVQAAGRPALSGRRPSLTLQVRLVPLLSEAG